MPAEDPFVDESGKVRGDGAEWDHGPLLFLEISGYIRRREFLGGERPLNEGQYLSERGGCGRGHGRVLMASFPEKVHELEHPHHLVLREPTVEGEGVGGSFFVGDLHLYLLPQEKALQGGPIKPGMV